MTSALFALGAGLLFAATSSGGTFDEVIDSPMYRLPDLPPSPVEMVFPKELKGLWLRALERSEAEMRMKAATTIFLAHRRNMKGLETTIAPLVAALETSDHQPAVRIAVAQALIELDARQSAALLFGKAERGGIEFREMIEPVLAHWDYPPARAMWLARLEEPATPLRSLVLAMRGLAVVREEQAVARLRKLAASDYASGPMRMEAARALGTIRLAGLEKDAEALAADATPRGLVGRLTAVHMLRRHSSPAAIVLLQRLARDQEPAVAVVAAARLLELDPALALPMVEHLLGSPAAELRSLGVETLFHSPTQDRLRRLGDRLIDVHPDVRKKARQRLLALAARKEFRQHIHGEGMRVLARSDWRGLEQATILLAQLEHRPAAARLVELLTHNRPEVFITAAWGLRKLADPETLPAVVKYMRAEFDRRTSKKTLPNRKDLPLDRIDHQLSQLNQLLGQAKYQPADPALRLFVPKRDGVAESRAAAIWALGMIHAGNAKAVPALVAELDGRLSDADGIPPEEAQVRRMSAVSLGRMNATQALPSLRKFWFGKISNDMSANACAWAIERITGEPMPAAETTRRFYRDWFLVPKE